MKGLLGTYATSFAQVVAVKERLNPDYVRLATTWAQVVAPRIQVKLGMTGLLGALTTSLSQVVAIK
jgi:hypothetical protein